jgi:hypothetical protein
VRGGIGGVCDAVGVVFVAVDAFGWFSAFGVVFLAGRNF